MKQYKYIVTIPLNPDMRWTKLSRTDDSPIVESRQAGQLRWSTYDSLASLTPRHGDKLTYHDSLSEAVVYIVQELTIAREHQEAQLWLELL